MGDVELVLRFLAFKVAFADFSHDVGPFMTKFMERIADSSSGNGIAFSYQNEKLDFEGTFRFLAKTLGENTCSRWMGSRFGGGFSNHHFEAFSLGVARVIARVPLDNPQFAERARLALEGVKKNPEFQDIAKGGGQNSPGLYDKKIEYVAQSLRAIL